MGKTKRGKGRGKLTGVPAIPPVKRLAAQVQSDAEHCASRIHKADRLTKGRTEYGLCHQRLRRQALFRAVVEQIEHVEQQIDPAKPTQRDWPRKTQIEQGL